MPNPARPGHLGWNKQQPFNRSIYMNIVLTNVMVNKHNNVLKLYTEILRFIRKKEIPMRDYK